MFFGCLFYITKKNKMAKKTTAIKSRNEIIKQLFSMGNSVEDISKVYHLSKVTICNAVKDGRKEKKQKKFSVIYIT